MRMLKTLGAMIIVLSMSMGIDSCDGQPWFPDLTPPPTTCQSMQTACLKVIADFIDACENQCACKSGGGTCIGNECVASVGKCSDPDGNGPLCAQQVGLNTCRAASKIDVPVPPPPDTQPPF